MAVGAQGTIIASGDGADPEVFLEIVEITDFDGPTVSNAQVDVTHLRSTTKQYIAGLRDGGTVSMNGNWVGEDDGQQRVQSDQNTRSTRNYRMTFPDTTTCIFPANVQTYGISGAVDGAIKCKIELKLTGDPVWTYPT
jgi:predicted secreted protein